MWQKSKKKDSQQDTSTLAAANSLMLNAMTQVSDIDIDSASVSGYDSGDASSRATTNKEKAEKVLADAATNSSGGDGGGGGNGGKSALAKKEERTVTIVRVLVMCAIFVSAITVSTAVYFFARDSDNSSFELEYYGFVKNIEALVVWEVKYNMALLQQLSGTTTSTALMTNQTFPYVTQPHFEITGGFVDGMGGIMMALSAPLIHSSKRTEWEEYATKNQNWLQESARLKVTHPQHRDPLHLTIQDHEHDRRRQLARLQEQGDEQEEVPLELQDGDFLKVDPPTIPTIPNKIWKWDGDEKVVVPEARFRDQVYAPLWQSSPADINTVNVDLLSDPRIATLYEAMVKTKQTVMSPGYEIGNLFDWMFDPEEKFRKAEPHAFIIEPMYTNFTNPNSDNPNQQEEDNAELVGFMIALTSYRNLFTRLLPEGSNGIYCVITDTCGIQMTFELNGPEAIFLGYDDLHEGMEEYESTIPLELYERTDADELCVHDLHIYPSRKFQESYHTRKPIVYTFVVALAFGITSLLLCIYDKLVTRRQERTKNAALRVVSSMFPSTVQDKVLKGHYDGAREDSDKDDNVIASFFPDTTVMFADIAGFTAWASTREPAQVFRLLETIYGAFDEIARRRSIFKVETVGDCYVAVSGVPTPRKDHAVAMLRFAMDIQGRMHSLSQELEVSLGPDTADLAFRIGIHSGPVTGGVLRGQNSRFQLFGDTMNMAARMESTGKRNRVQISSTTADLIVAGGKGNWIEKRGEKIEVKGKGYQDTFWLKSEKASPVYTASPSVRVPPKGSFATSLTDDEGSFDGDSQPRSGAGSSSPLTKKTERLVDWNTEVLLRRIKAILVQRENSKDIEIQPNVIKQLRRHIHAIACMYPDNPFHNFEHASHVTLSIEKMLSRVQTNSETAEIGYANDITSDPLAQFAVVYAALVHDVDHPGVSNDQLIKENARIAQVYNNKSPAENHSLSLSWGLLMKPEFEDLVNCICPTRFNLNRLEKMVMNAVLATDVFDKELKEGRNLRWEQVFSESSANQNFKSPAEFNHVKALIVLEYLIQASDVVHTMQHWHVYIKWNERLYEEMCSAYNDGRVGKNPAEFWYQGEINFFDYYIIPLAKRLGECNVFGLSCDEFLNYAQANRDEWERKGRDIIAGYIKKQQQQQ